MKEYKYIDGFKLGDIEFLGAYAFKGDNNTLLLSEYGSSIILSNNLVELVENNNIIENLAIKLYQRGFVKLFDRDRFFENKKEDNLPTFFMIDFTTKCNLNCIYCLRHFENEGKSINYNQLYRICDYIIKYCKKHNIYNIGFQPWGGEPLIEIDKIIESKKRFEKAGISVNYTVQTNGLLLTPENYLKLQDNRIGFGISLDGTKEVHNSHRVDLNGNETFDILMKRMDEIKKIDSKCEFYTLSVNSMYTLEHIEKSIKYMVENLGIKHLKFNLVHPNGKDFDKNMLIKKQNMEEFAKRVFYSVVEENKKGYNVVESNIKIKILNVLNNSERDLCHSSGCKGGRKFVSFSQDGNIYPCELIGNEKNCIGNIEDNKDLAELIEEAINSKPYFKEKKNSKCEKCPYYTFCKGGCTASAISYNKKPGEIDDMECEFNLAIYPLIIKTLLNQPDIIEKLIEGEIKLN